MAANTNINIADLDFATIKQNFITYLQSQDTFKDYNFEGSGLSVLLDVLSYNTQYNGYYLNMVANEMFLDTALQRNSVVSHAKLLNYVPRSNIAPSALINVAFYGVTSSSLTIPKFTNFMSESIDGVNYNFVTIDATTSNTDANGNVYFTNLAIYEGNPSSYSFTVDSTTNPTFIFEIPDPNIDTTTLQVTVQQNSTNSAYQIFTKAQDYALTSSNSAVYFLQEGLNGNYQLQFGDGILGQKLSDGNLIYVTYVSTNGTAALGANSFVLLDSISNSSNVTITGASPTSNGQDRETVDSVKFSAPKSYAAQGRAVTKDDYITALQQNNIGISFDAVNVWGGQENNPPVYGQAFICLKPSGAYTLTDTQKQRLITEVLNPISVVTVVPNIIDPDYNYIKINVNATYNSRLTNYTSGQIQQLITNAVMSYASSNLNTFNSTFSSSLLNYYISQVDPSIIASEISIKVQKKFFPLTSGANSYELDFNVPLQRGILTSGVSSAPTLEFRDPITPTTIIGGVYIEEIPSYSAGISNIEVINPGFGYAYPPIINIVGDGSGATATATIVNGSISAINITNSGNNYTSAAVVIANAPNDNSGKMGAAIPTIQGQYGTLRSYYYKNGVKNVLNSNVGTIDYVNGIINLNSFDPYWVDNPLGQLTMTATPTTTIISSSYNKIITVDPYDPAAVVVNLSSTN